MKDLEIWELKECRKQNIILSGQRDDSEWHVQNQIMHFNIQCASIVATSAFMKAEFESACVQDRRTVLRCFCVQTLILTGPDHSCSL